METTQFETVDNLIVRLRTTIDDLLEYKKVRASVKRNKRRTLKTWQAAHAQDLAHDQEVILSILTPATQKVFACLQEGPQTKVDVASKVGLAKQTVENCLYQLHRAKLAKPEDDL